MTPQTVDAPWEPVGRAARFATQRASRFWEWVARALLALFYLLMAHRFAVSYAESRRISSLLILVASTVMIVIYLTRRHASLVTTDPLAWGAALAGTWFTLLLTPAEGGEYLAGQALQAIGVAMQIIAVMSLARSFGIVPANRGIKTGGLYRVVRHPLYTAYLLSNTGFLINQFSVRNLVVLVIWMCFQLQRVHFEEKFLEADPNYRTYMGETRWRLVPLVY